ncbi:MAG: formylglycine-generating enzyme family protein [Bacteroidetes bacterium HGW-Bacteroidetes-19]|nr:MAG: formylglycine-generating enzyme family protein [Bacteroidetes bacterium HGW-Bacteroidetes-19]
MLSNKNNLFYSIFVFLTCVLIFESCNSSKSKTSDNLSALTQTRDSLDAISRDTISVDIKNCKKTIKMAWSRNTTTHQKKLIQELIQELIYVDGGTFLMGCNTPKDTQCVEAEFPSHLVTLDPFFIGKFEITQLLWVKIMDHDPNTYKGNTLPVTSISWDDCQEFIKRLNHITSLNFALPTEAQWEFAARGGIKSKNTPFAGSKEINEVAWYKGNSKLMYQSIGTLAPNELGLHDMSGNVWEWCSDFYGPYSTEQQKNPKGPESGVNRVYRGGSWLDNQSYIRITTRNCGRPDYKMNCLGFRLILIQ